MAGEVWQRTRGRPAPLCVCRALSARGGRGWCGEGKGREGKRGEGRRRDRCSGARAGPGAGLALRALPALGSTRGVSAAPSPDTRRPAPQNLQNRTWTCPGPPCLCVRRHSVSRTRARRSISLYRQRLPFPQPLMEKPASRTGVQFMFELPDCRPSDSFWPLTTALDPTFDLPYGTEDSFVACFWFLL